VDANPTQAAFARHCGVDSFPLLSDIDRKVAKLYGVLRPEWFSEKATFLIDKDGVIRWTQKVPPYEQRDIEEIFSQLRRLGKAA
jgi:peroxiredoxin